MLRLRPLTKPFPDVGMVAYNSDVRELTLINAPPAMALGLTPEDEKSAKELSKICKALSITSYGIVLILLISSLYLLLRVPKTRQPSQRVRRFVFIFLAFTFSISTISTALVLSLNFKYPIASFTPFSVSRIDQTICLHNDCYVIKVIQSCCVALAIWVADGFMIWRCTVLYSGVSLFYRRIVLAICAAMVVISAAAGFVYTAPFASTNLTLITFSGITLGVNCSVTALIVGRLLYHRHYLTETLGPRYGSPYLKLIALFIESASMVVIFNVVLIILACVKSQKGHSLILLEMMVQNYVISPFLIIFKVAYDKVHHPQLPRIQTQDVLEVRIDRTLTAIEFAKVPSRESQQSVSTSSEVRMVVQIV